VSGEQRDATDVMLREAASLLHLLGSMGAAHLLLIGGLVPPLLTSSPRELHIGTADIDFLMSVAFTQGTTAEYYQSIEEKLSKFFATDTDAFAQARPEAHLAVNATVRSLRERIDWDIHAERAVRRNTGRTDLNGNRDRTRNERTPRP
jgi:hypothetical protein